MRFIYADPGLVTDLGHHANSCRCITGELKARGIPYSVLAYRGVTPELQSELGAQPYFRAYTYQFSDADPICGWLNAFQLSAEMNLQDLLALPIGADDILYFNSAQPAQLMGIARWMTSLPVERVPRIVMEFGTDPGVEFGEGPEAHCFLPKDARIDSRAVLHRFASQYIPRSLAYRLRLTTFEQFSSSIYSELLRFPVGVLPLPIDGAQSLRTRGDRRPITVAVLGHQRRDKGYHLMPEVAEILLGLRPNIRLLIHNGAPNEMPDVQSSLRTLAAGDSRIRLDERLANPRIWNELLDAADLILCPYEPTRFRTSYSAVAAEAIVNAIPLVVPAMTSLSRLVTDFGGAGAVFDRFEPEAIATATVAALDGFEEYAGRALTGANRWAQTHGARQMVDAIIESVSKPVVPSIVFG